MHAYTATRLGIPIALRISFLISLSLSPSLPLHIHRKDRSLALCGSSLYVNSLVGIARW